LEEAIQQPQRHRQKIRRPHRALRGTSEKPIADLTPPQHSNLTAPTVDLMKHNRHHIETLLLTRRMPGHPQHSDLTALLADAMRNRRYHLETLLLFRPMPGHPPIRMRRQPLHPNIATGPHALQAGT
jgi:hypothetical protein